VAGALAVGCVVSFGEGGASFPRDLREVQPTVLLGTPRTWERMRQTAEGRMADATLVKRAVYRWCVAQGREVSARLAAGSPKATDPARRALCWLLCLRQLRHKLGLGRIATAVTTGTTDAQVLQWFEAIGAPLRDGWGPALEAELGPLLGSWSSTHAAGRVAP
jgi:long-chain acyl-CoA synthetase